MSPRRKKPPKPVVVYRDAKLEDVLTLLPLGEASFYETGYDKFSTFDKTSAVKSLELLIREKDGMLFVVEVDGELVGMAAAIVYPLEQNPVSGISMDCSLWTSSTSLCSLESAPGLPSCALTSWGALYRVVSVTSTKIGAGKYAHAHSNKKDRQ